MGPIVVLLALCSIRGCEALIEGLYCGKENCYDVLNVSRDATKGEISKSYRRLARLYHPDKYKGKDGEKKFISISNAYEILKEDDSRQDYDYMLDNPDELYRNYYRYYRRKVVPKVDPKIVVAVTISVISLIQYYVWWARYNEAINSIMMVPKYRLKAMEMATSQGLISKQKKKDKRSKDEIKEEENEILRKIVEENADIRGVYCKPLITDVLWIQIFIFPYYIFNYIVWYLRWIWKFNIKREEYGDDEKQYLIRKHLRVSQGQFDALTDEQKQVYIDREAWVFQNFKELKEELMEEERKKLANNSKYKMYRRFMKNKGVSRMTFED
ncbi:dnaJ homolog subfamily C member 25-like [Anneissia japonica]|uniref:dnaJ homolog subfamily C member 25-like n=1 Tax=Anneissia japonica TaxID=1529436 RepID=UPI001425BB7C|nr:dnaJ homolog subfamily C member 25-like [Anneissia japonica]